VTGSLPITKTIGTVEVACFTASAFAMAVLAGLLMRLFGIA
jgi:hypothetical protein